jgi:hypothetical protein
MLFGPTADRPAPSLRSALDSLSPPSFPLAMSSARRHSLPTSLLYHDSSSNGNGHANGSASRRGPTANGIAALGPLYLGLEVALDRVRAVVLDGGLGIAHSVELELGSLQASPPYVPRCVSPCATRPQQNASLTTDITLRDPCGRQDGRWAATWVGWQSDPVARARPRGS